MTVKLKTPSNGSVSLTPQDTASDVVLTVPATSTTMLAGSGFSLSASAPSNTFVTDASGNVGIGTSSPSQAIDIVRSANNAYLRTSDGTINALYGASNGAGAGLLGTLSNHPQVFWTNNAERMRITSSGGVGIGTTSPGGKFGVETTVASDWPIIAKSPDRGFYNINTGTSGIAAYFSTSNGSVVAGQISVSGNTTTYNSASDYRLKNNIRPLSNGLDRVMRFKPCEWEWKSDGRVGVGFIAHEIQEERPQAVVGEKDVMDADGNPVYQCMDSSVLIADLTAAIQEQQAIINQLQARIEALENA